MKVMKAKKCVSHLLVLPLLAVLLLTSCARHSAVWPQLVEAEKLLDADLPAAAALIDSVDASPLRGEDAALYAILKTQADYKGYIPLASDSLPRVATAYYGTPRLKNYRAAMAWYTLGCCYTDMGRPEEAFGAYLKARHCFPTTQNRYYSLCEQNIGKCYLDRCLYDDAIESFTHSRDVSVAIGDSTQIAWCDYFLGNSYLRKLDYDRADSLYQKSKENPYASQRIINDLPFQLAKIEFYHHKDYRQTIEQLQNYLHHVDNIAYDGSSWVRIGEAYYNLQLLDSAAICYAFASTSSKDIYSTDMLLYDQLKLSFAKTEQDSMITLLDEFVAINDSLHMARNHTEISHLKEDFDHLQRENNLKHLFYIIAALSVIAFLLLIVSLLSHSNHKRKEYIRIIDEMKRTRMAAEREQLAEISKVTEESAQLMQQYQAVCQRMNELESQAAEAIPFESAPADFRSLTLADYQSRMDICARQFKEGASWNFAYKFVHGSEHYLTKEERAAIKHDLNVCFTDYYGILAAEGTKINDRDKIVSACYYLGLKVEEMEEILSIPATSIRVQKHRIKEKIPTDLFDLIYNMRTE